MKSKEKLVPLKSVISVAVNTDPVEETKYEE
jgi:hypothetical protein